MRPIQQRTLTKIDAALNDVMTQRLGHFQRAKMKYNGSRNTNYLGIEAMVKAELYLALQRQFDEHSVFLEFPGLERDRIDVLVDGCVVQMSYRSYIEMKMYYTKSEDHYTHDFNKLRTMIRSDNDALAVHLHFKLYQNKNRPNEIIMDELKASLSVDEYWTDTQMIGTDMYHFYRLAFGLKHDCQP